MMELSLLKEYDIYICKYCNNIYENVHQTICGCRYCLVCFESTFSKKKCFICNAELYTKQTFKDRGFEKEIENKNIKCAKCNWNGSLKFYRKHFEETHKIMNIECPFHEIGCENYDPLIQSIDSHLTNNINVHLKITKDYFENNLKRSNEKTEILKKEIESLKLVISNEKEKIDNPKSDNIIFDTIKSDLNHFIVSIETLHKKLEEYEENERITDEKCKNLEKVLSLTQSQVISLEQDVYNLRNATYNGVLVWKITHVKDKIQDAISSRQTSHYSSHFYTSLYGYKMCARIYLNGDGVGRNTHVSLFFVICRGENDALLKWPFKQKITFMLIDQLSSENKENMVDAFKPDPSSSSFKRPTSDMNIASGIPLFCPLNKLKSSEHEYIKDDCMFIKVIVDCRDIIDI